MDKFFNVNIEFDKEVLDKRIFDTIANGGKGYVCSVESNNLTVANTDPNYLKVINGALVNNCDGSVLAAILGRIHHKPLTPYIGADIFLKYVGLKRFRQFFLGNTSEILCGLKSNLSSIDPAVGNMRFETLPFRRAEEFDYENIAKMINDDDPDIIWVSLGAPKQELFMASLEPHLKRGVMFGIGATFNFNAGVGNVRRAPEWMLRLRLEWLHRAIEQPKKNIPRYWRFLRVLPGLIREEKTKVNNSCT